MYLHQLLENLLTYVQCIFWSAEWDRWGVPKHVPLPTEFHKTLEALTSQSGNHTAAASSSESPSKA